MAHGMHKAHLFHFLGIWGIAQCIWRRLIILHSCSVCSKTHEVFVALADLFVEAEDADSRWGMLRKSQPRGSLSSWITTARYHHHNISSTR